MTDATLSDGRFTESEFRVGRVVSRTWSVLRRNFLIFLAVSAVAAMPRAATDTIGDPFEALQMGGIRVEGLGPVLGYLLSALSEAVVLYGAFQDMRGERVSLGQSMRAGLRRFFPLVRLAVGMAIFGFLGFIAFVVPGLIFFTMSFVAVPACVVEERGVLSSIARSMELTRGHRWRIFALMLFWYGSDALAQSVIDPVISVAGAVPAFVAHVIWNGVWGAFYSIFAVVTYHDLRVAREGVDIGQIAAVFE